MARKQVVNSDSDSGNSQRESSRRSHPTSNRIEAKRTSVNERIMKMEIKETPPGKDTPDPILQHQDRSIVHATVGNIEGYRPLYGTKQSSQVVHEQNGDEEEKKEEEKGSYVLSDRDVDEENVVVESPEEDVRLGGDELTEDEKIWKEIFGADAKLPGDDDDDEDVVVGKITLYDMSHYTTLHHTTSRHLLTVHSSTHTLPYFGLQAVGCMWWKGRRMSHGVTGVYMPSSIVLIP